MVDSVTKGEFATLRSNGLDSDLDTPLTCILFLVLVDMEVAAAIAAISSNSSTSHQHSRQPRVDMVSMATIPRPPLLLLLQGEQLPDILQSNRQPMLNTTVTTAVSAQDDDLESTFLYLSLLHPF